MKFRKYLENSTDFVNTVKKQFNVPKKTWLGTPVLVTPGKVAGIKIDEPTLFKVVDVQDDKVTLERQVDGGDYEDSGFDSDGEMESRPNERKRIVVDVNTFYKMVEPPAGQGGGGGIGGNLGI